MEEKHLLLIVLFVTVNTLTSAQGVVWKTTAGCKVTVDLPHDQETIVKQTTLGTSPPQITLVLDAISNTKEILFKRKIRPKILINNNGHSEAVLFRSVILSSLENVSWTINTNGTVSGCKKDKVNKNNTNPPALETSPRTDTPSLETSPRTDTPALETSPMADTPAQETTPCPTRLLRNANLYFLICLVLLTVSIIINIVLLVCVYSQRRQRAQLALAKGALAATRDRAAANNNAMRHNTFAPHQPSVPGAPLVYRGNEFYSETESEENYYEDILDMRY